MPDNVTKKKKKNEINNMPPAPKIIRYMTGKKPPNPKNKRYAESGQKYQEIYFSLY